jgi:hypothetical protein
MPGLVLGDIVSWCRLYMAAKPSHVGVDVDRLTCPLHHHMAYSHQMRGQSFPTGVALSHYAAVGGGAFPGGGKTSGLDIRWSVDCLGTYVTKPYMQ